VISGYLIASTSIKSSNGGLMVDAARFYVRRATRIFPLLLLATAVGVAVLNFGGGQSGVRPFQYLFCVPGTVFTSGFWISIAAFYFNWYRVLAGGETHGWFGLQWDVLWSLSVEEQFYFAFPWVISLCRTAYRTRVFMYSVVIICVTSRFILVSYGSGLLSEFANAVICFDSLAVGVIISLSAPWNARYSRLSIGMGAILLAFSYLCGATVLGGLPSFLVALSTGLLIQGSRGSVSLKRGFSEPVLPAFGKLSYGLYLLHPIGFFLVASSSVLSLNPALGFVITLVAVFILAKISFNLYETPIERVSRGWLYKIIPARSGGHEDLKLGSVREI
jgi:peptidoglycan/LPS O-acetylase OafA/YrhL